MRYLAASVVIAAAAAVYGLFSHGVYSYFMTYAFAIPLLIGAMPHLIAALDLAVGKAVWIDIRCKRRTAGNGRDSDCRKSAERSA